MRRGRVVVWEVGLVCEQFETSKRLQVPSSGGRVEAALSDCISCTISRLGKSLHNLNLTPWNLRATRGHYEDEQANMVLPGAYVCHYAVNLVMRRRGGCIITLHGIGHCNREHAPFHVQKWKQISPPTPR